MDNILEIKHLCKEYEAFKLEDITFSVKKGSIMGFIGRNGAGKTTTLKGIINLVHPTSGNVVMFGKDFSQNELQCKEKLAFVLGGVDYFQTKKLKTITQVTKKFYKNFDMDKYNHYLKVFDLNENKYFKELSNGMKVKYSLALALSHNAELFILDEPTSGLDPISRDEILEIFLNLVKDKSRSILFSTHITSDLEKCADDIAYIKKGKMVTSSSKNDFIESYRKVIGKSKDLNEKTKSLLIHYKELDNGEYEGLIHTADASSFSNAQCMTTDLETIMIFEERNFNYEEFIV